MKLGTYLESSHFKPKTYPISLISEIFSIIRGARKEIENNMISMKSGFIVVTCAENTKRGVQLELCTDIGMRFFVFKVRII